MKMGNTERLVFTIIMGFAVILNLIGSSYLEFYPTSLLIGVAFAVGISMIVGSAYHLLKEPGLIRKVKSPNSIRLDHPLKNRRANAVPS